MKTRRSDTKENKLSTQRLLNRDELLAETLKESYNSFTHGKDGVVATQPNTLAWMDAGTVLANDNIAGNDFLTTRFLDTKTFAGSS